MYSYISTVNLVRVADPELPVKCDVSPMIKPPDRRPLASPTSISRVLNACLCLRRVCQLRGLELRFTVKSGDSNTCSPPEDLYLLGGHEVNVTRDSHHDLQGSLARWQLAVMNGLPSTTSRPRLIDASVFPGTCWAFSIHTHVPDAPRSRPKEVHYQAPRGKRGGRGGGAVA